MIVALSFDTELSFTQVIVIVCGVSHVPVQNVMNHGPTVHSDVLDELRSILTSLVGSESSTIV